MAQFLSTLTHDAMTSTSSDYPPTTIDPKGETVTILQLTDLHLHEDLDENSRPNNHHKHFEALLTQALAQGPSCDLILVTGDLVNTVTSAVYDRIFATLEQSGIAFACVAGNHDVTEEIDTHLPFEQRRLVARPLDSRLLDQYCIETPSWQLLLINSAIPGLIGGNIRAESLSWLRDQLTNCNKPALLALHHHVIPVASDWIDAHMAANTEALWALLAKFPQVRGIISGHVHQAQTNFKQGVIVYSSPATSYQFKPLCDNFAYDDSAAPGCRWLQLFPDGQIRSWVSRFRA